MKTDTVQKLIWPLIYGGLVLLILGLYVDQPGVTLAWVLRIAGAAAIVIGALLIVVRSRMGERR